MLLSITVPRLFPLPTLPTPDCEPSGFGIAAALVAVQEAGGGICSRVKEVGLFKKLEKAMVTEEGGMKVSVTPAAICEGEVAAT